MTVSDPALPARSCHLSDGAYLRHAVVRARLVTCPTCEAPPGVQCRDDRHAGAGLAAAWPAFVEQRRADARTAAYVRSGYDRGVVRSMVGQQLDAGRRAATRERALEDLTREELLAMARSVHPGIDSQLTGYWGQ